MTRLDAVLALVMAAVSVAFALVFPVGPPFEPPGAPTLAVAAAGGLALLWRQTAPLVAQAGTSSAIVATAAMGSSIGFLDWPAWIALFSCFAVGGRTLRAAATAIAGLGVAGYLLFDRGDPFADLPFILVNFLIATVAGELSRRRTGAVAAETRRAAEHREQALAAERLLLHERGRLARELHDSLGHTVNVVVLQAGVGRRVFDDNPGYAKEALTSIETAGRVALEELDRLLRVLQPDQRTAEAAQFAPTIGDVEQLADRIRATGREVELRADPVTLTPGAARALYRIVQEALTNAVRHTRAGLIRVRISQAAGQVLLEVTNEGQVPPPGALGRGLVNMRERARLEGGELEAGPVDGGFRVRALLPVAGAVSP